MISQLTGTQRKKLRGMAHLLKPIVHIGHGGLSEGLYANLDQALESHELVKVKFVDFKDQKKEAVAEIEEHLQCASAGIVGHIAILFRPARDPEKRKIEV